MQVFVEGSPNRDGNVPGPGNYNPNKPLGNDALKFSIKGKGLKRSGSTSNRLPGPGEYPVDSFNPTGHYPLSQNKNAVNICFSASKDQRFIYQGKINIKGFRLKDTRTRSVREQSYN